MGEVEVIATKKGPWFYASLIAVTVAFLGTGLALLPHALMPEKDAAMLSVVLGIFFAEFVMVLSALGLLAYLKTQEKSPVVRRIAKLNGTLLVTGFFIGIWLFLG